MVFLILFFYWSYNVIRQSGDYNQYFFRDKMRTNQRTAHKTPIKYTTQKLGPSSAPVIVEKFFQTVKKFHNPCVILELCCQIEKWEITSTIEINFSTHGSKEKQTLIRQVKKAASDIYSIYKYFKDQKSKLHQLLKHKAKSLSQQFFKYQHWQGAYIMLNSQAVRKLELRFVKQLIELFEQKKYQQIHTFFKDTLYKSNLIKEAQFQNYIKSKKVLVRNVQYSLKNFDQLIHWIKKTAPPQDISSRVLIQKLKKYKQLEGSIIEISDPDPQKNVNGKVMEAQYKNKKLYLKLKRTKDQINLQVQLDDKEKAISHINVEQFELVPIQNLIKIENKKHWDIIDSTKTKIQYLIKENCQIQLSSCSLPNVLITPGFYDIFCSTEVKNDDQCYELCFKQEGYEKAKQYRIQVYIKSSINQKYIVFEKKKSLYNQLIKSYQIRQSKRYQITNQDQILEKSFKIQKYFNSSDNRYLYQKLNNIEQKKNSIIRSLKSKHFQDSSVFKQFINSGEIDQDGLKRIGIMNAIKEIICDYSQIEQSTSEQQLIKQLIANFNYASFVPKYQTLKSISMINHFVNSQKAVQTMVGKDIIALLGNTGSGKSTTADFLIGVPLKETKNCYGDKIIQIDQQQARKQNLVSSAIAKIGHSCVLSQTIYSRGHKIIEKKGQNLQISQNVIICDNPGFQDTRGLFFQVCTRLSMDRAFYLCKSIGKVVLVLPEEIIKSQKSIHLINIMTQLYERFEQLQDHLSDEFSNFYIFITKARESYQKIQNIQAYIKGTLCQYKSHMSQVTSKYGINEQKNLKDKITIFTNLLKMIEQERIIYLHVTIQLQRIDILLQLGVISNQEQPTAKKNNELKDKYKRCLDDKYLRQFAHQVSISAHTFTEIILKEYLVKIPAKISEIKNQISKVHKAINKHLQQAHHLKNKIRQKQQLKSSKKLLINKNRVAISNIQNNKTAEMQNFIKLSKERNDFKYKQKKDLFQSNISMEKWSLAENQAQSRKINQSKIAKEKKLAELTQKYKQYTKQVQTWKKSYVIEEILNVSYQPNQFINLKNEIDSFRAGKKNIKLCRSTKLKREFKLMPNQQFDPTGQIPKTFFYGKYRASVQSRNMTLESIKTMPDGSKNLYIILDFKTTDKKQQLPFLRITYQLSGQEHFMDAIRNKGAQIAKLFKQMDELETEIEEQKKREKLHSRQIQMKQSKILLKEQQRLKIGYQMQRQQRYQLVKLKQDYKQQHQKSILQQQQELKSIQGSISQYLKQIKDHEDHIAELKNELNCTCTPVLQNNYLTSVRNPEVKEQSRLILTKRTNIRQEIKRQTVQYNYQKTQKSCQCHKLQEKLKQKQWVHKRMAFLIKDQFTKKIPQTLKKFIDFTQILKMQNAEYKTGIFAQFKQVFDKQEATLLKKVQQHLKQS